MAPRTRPAGQPICTPIGNSMGIVARGGRRAARHSGHYRTQYEGHAGDNGRWDIDQTHKIDQAIHQVGGRWICDRIPAAMKMGNSMVKDGLAKPFITAFA